MRIEWFIILLLHAVTIDNIEFDICVCIFYWNDITSSILFKSFLLFEQNRVDIRTYVHTPLTQLKCTRVICNRLLCMKLFKTQAYRLLWLKTTSIFIKTFPLFENMYKCMYYLLYCEPRNVLCSRSFNDKLATEKQFLFLLKINFNFLSGLKNYFYFHLTNTILKPVVYW